MNAVIGALRVVLGLDSAAFEKGASKSQRTLSKLGKSMQSFGASMSARVTAPLAAAGAAITAALSGVAGEITGLQNAARVAGAGFQEFQKLAYAAKTVGIESDKLGDIYKDVNDKVGDFLQNGGGEMADFFTNIAPKVGVTAEAFRNLSGPQALQLYYDSLQKAGLSQAEMTFYMEAVADEATALIPLLQNGGAEFARLGDRASELGTVFSDETAAQAAKFSASMAELGASLRALAVVIANSGLIEWVTQAVQTITGFVQQLARTNPEIVKWGAIVGGLAAIIGPVVAALGLMVAGIAAIGVPVAAAIAGIAALAAAVVAFWPEIQAAWEWVKKLVEVFIQLHTQALDAVIQKFQELRSSIIAALAGLGEEILAVFRALPGQMIQIGQDIINGLWQGIQNKWEELKGGVANIASGIKESFTGFFDIHSPSRVMEEIGMNLMQGLGNGMIGSSAPVLATASNVAGGIRGAFDGMDSVGSGLGNGITSAFDGIGSSLAEAIKGTKEWRDVALDALRSIASNLLSTMNFGGGFGGGLLKGLLGGLVGFQNGGSFQVGGAGGIDSQIVAFRASPDERVSITKPGQRAGGGTYAPVYNIDARGADQAAIARLERGLAERDRTEAKRVAGFEHTRSTRNTRP
ncbi:hypothetical protein [Sinorhizobium meliloti]|uniref:hypothetical protein n=1 Tax=Rhizobium meliloti TaxID=382 RepID=UPI000FE0DA72|nr:hypothetical protein [Sinorhizobium meliloti]RVL53958.1 hypothetical protein CN141_25575 [Sinorhizobium meliloti]